MALDEAVRATICPGSTLTENANLLVMPNPDVARMGEDCLHLSAVVLDFPSPRFASLLVYLSQLVSTPNAPPPPGVWEPYGAGTVWQRSSPTAWRW